MKTRVVPLFEESITARGGDRICLQYCRYEYDDNGQNTAFRLIRRGPDGNLKAQRGQAGIPSLAELEALVKAAKKAGWGDYVGTMD